MDRRERRMERTRTALLEEALKLFAERGIHTTRVEDITDAVDVAKGSFYNYFDSKDVLVAEILAGAVATLEQRYLDPVPASPDIVAHLSALMGAHQAFVDDFPAYSLVLHQARGLLQLRSGRSEQLQAAVQSYLACLARHLPLPSGVEGAPARRLQLAALLAGLVSGPRSFSMAADVPYDRALVREVACRGLAAVLTEAPSAAP
jgi:AcrR family transcriptional regulator